ncbi:MAG: hypothetical protein LBU33_00355 [Endomicrobium sp.]|jgi:hypothetical protein|nr:hypothetical protein [Endomicrobium sp.]
MPVVEPHSISSLKIKEEDAALSGKTGTVSFGEDVGAGSLEGSRAVFDVSSGDVGTTLLSFSSTTVFTVLP